VSVGIVARPSDVSTQGYTVVVFYSSFFFRFKKKRNKLEF
jgi:hypothetical protein